METLDALIDFLAKDGVWHTISEISTLEAFRKLKITNLMELLYILAECDFIELEEKETELLEESGDYFPDVIIEAKINPEVAVFWRRLNWIERANVP